jgi:hypothetical protein
LFVDVPEVEIEIGHRGHSGVTQGYDILDDRGTELIMSASQQMKRQENADQSMLFPDPATELRNENSSDQEPNQSMLGEDQEKLSNARFPCTHKNDPVDFHSLNILP